MQIAVEAAQSAQGRISDVARQRMPERMKLQPGWMPRQDGSSFLFDSE